MFLVKFADFKKCWVNLGNLLSGLTLQIQPTPLQLASLIMHDIRLKFCFMTFNNKALNQKSYFTFGEFPNYSELVRKIVEVLSRSRRMSSFKKFLQSYFLGHRHGKSCNNHDFSKMSKIWTIVTICGG